MLGCGIPTHKSNPFIYFQFPLGPCHTAGRSWAKWTRLADRVVLVTVPPTLLIRVSFNLFSFSSVYRTWPQLQLDRILSKLFKNTNM